MAERSKALRSGRSQVLLAWVRIPLPTSVLPFGQWSMDAQMENQRPAYRTLVIGSRNNTDELKPPPAGDTDSIVVWV